MQCREVDIGVLFDKPIDTSFMNDIMQGGIAYSGLESNGDVFFEDSLQDSNLQSTKKWSDEEFDTFLESQGIDAKAFREW